MTIPKQLQCWVPQFYQAYFAMPKTADADDPRSGESESSDRVVADPDTGSGPPPVRLGTRSRLQAGDRRHFDVSHVVEVLRRFWANRRPQKRGCTRPSASSRSSAWRGGSSVSADAIRRMATRFIVVMVASRSAGDIPWIRSTIIPSVKPSAS